MAYWRLGEKSGTTAFDSFGGHDGIYENVTLGLPGYSSTDPDTSAGFDPASHSDVVVTNAAAFNFSGATPQFTYEAWVNFNDLTGIQRVFSNGQPGNFGLGFGINTASGLRFTTYGVQDFDQSLPQPLQTNTWYHLAGVATGGTFYFYLNGQLVGSIAFSGAGKTSTLPFQLGRNPVTTAEEDVSGQIDEAAVYNRPLTSEEILTHYSAGRYGTTTPPLIVQQPFSVTAAAGSVATFNVQAGGSIPLAYQWSKAGVAISGATGSSLVLSNVLYTDAGTYSVTITNANGTTNSSPAVLTVMPVPTFANLTNGLVLHLKFEGDYNDSSGRGNNASSSGTPQFVVPGKLGQAVHLQTDTASSSFNYLTISDPNGDLSFDTTNSFSVALWLNYSAAFNDLPIIGNAVNSTYQKGYVLSEDGGRFEWTAVGVDTGSIIADPVGGPLINNGAWHHLAVVFDRAANLANSYVDGTFVDSRSISGLGTLITGNALTVGQDPTGSYAVSGAFSLDDMGIWRRALSGYEVLSIYNAAQNSGQSFDVYGPVKVVIQQSGGSVIVAWQAGTLQSTDEIKADPKQTVWAPVSGAAAPTYIIQPSAGRKFYRVAL
jgi:hypothetical protein